MPAATVPATPVPSQPLAPHAELARLHARLLPADGVTERPLPGVLLARASHPELRMPVMYEPGVCFVLQGRKRCRLGHALHQYDPLHYLVASAPLALDCDITASPGEPLLGVVLRVDPGSLSELLLSMDAAHGSSAVPPAGIVTTALTPALLDAVRRLLEALQSDEDARVLGPGIVREIFYRVLTGEQGEALRAALAHRGDFGQIAKVLRRMHDDCAAPVDVPTLAQQAHMSLATFHAKFKTVTATSPMQYLKATRLHRARLLMLQDGLNASSAAARVGYESVSQFSREFKRLFGRTPTDEMDAVRGRLPRRAAAPASTPDPLQLSEA